MALIKLLKMLYIMFVSMPPTISQSVGFKGDAKVKASHF
jgi:hypothetical protein